MRISDWSSDVCSSDLKDPHLRKLVLLDEQFFFSSAGFSHVERGEDALVGDLAVKHDFAIAGALELFEDDLIHTAARINQSRGNNRSEEHTSELQSLMRISYAVFCLKKKNKKTKKKKNITT